MGFQRDFLAERSDESLLEELRRVAARLGQDSLTQAEFAEHALISVSLIKKRFGTWNNALKKAGLHVSKRMDIPDDEILAEIGRVWTLLGHSPSREEFDELSTVSSALLKKRFGGHARALERFIKSADGGEPERTDGAAPIGVTAPQGMSIRPAREGARCYGDLIDFRGMQHAPLNELGVVFLFGMIAKELGFVVEAIGAGFPDCEAKAYDKKRRLWRKIAVEFEFKSSNFLKHKHDPAKCDLIVCWVHDWKESPIDVLDLGSVVRKAMEPVDKSHV